MSKLRGLIEGKSLFVVLRQVLDHRLTGILHVKDRSDEVELYFREGNLLRVKQDKRSRNERLGELMRRGAFISKDQISYSLALQKETLQRIGRIFVERLGIEPELVEEFARLQNSDHALEVLLWQTGTFEFELREVAAPWERNESISVENLLTEAATLRAEWPTLQIEQPKPKDGFQQAKPIPLVQEDGISSDDRRMFDSFDIARTFDSALYRSRLGKYRGARAIVRLVAGGYLKSGKPAKNRQERAWWSRAWSRLNPPQVAGAAMTHLVIVAALVTLFMTADLSWYGLQSGPMVRFRPQTMENYLWTTNSEVFRRSLELYRLRHGQYPQTLQDLKGDWVLSRQFFDTYLRDRVNYWSDGKQFWFAPRLPAGKEDSYLIK
ncbi:MAG: DUF4388 domain-containing protein [Myxococcota bacterium]|nr:DUF4388 domain-containing protein [Myxococcota bacterium]